MKKKGVYYNHREHTERGKKNENLQGHDKKRTYRKDRGSKS